uniref:DUF5057 domain-containing protein n=1 Tax=candidate division CPR3 bacterium TaxID=2268181 RepID=A0A7C4M4Y1_UNCC3
MRNLLFSKYGARLAIYKTKKFLGNIFSSKGGSGKKSRLFSVLAVFVIAGLIFSLSVYGFNLRGEAGDKTKISASTGDVILEFLQIAPTGYEPLLSTIFRNYGEFDYNGTHYKMKSDYVFIGDFNANPALYNINSYDGLVLGFANTNNGQDLTASSLAVVSSFIDSGKPVIFGHDTVNYTDNGGWGGGCSPNLTYFPQLRDKIGITNNGWKWCQFPFQSPITTTWSSNFSPKINKSSDQILNTPYDMSSNYNGSLQTLATHTLGEVYVDANDVPAPAYPDLKHYFCNDDAQAGTYTTYRNCYLTINGRFGQAQLGNTQGIPTDAEQKLYVNLLFNAYINSNPPTPPVIGATNYENTYNYNYKGISIHTKAQNINGSTEYLNTATVKRGSGHKVRFTLTVNNADVAKPVDVRFTLPATFSYSNMISPAITPKAGSCAGVNMPAGGTDVMYWCGFNAPVGDSTIIFEVNAP